MKALILAAGLGTRLKPLTEIKAKPALPVLGIPTFWYSAWQMLRELKPTAFAMNKSYLPDTLVVEAKDTEIVEHTRLHFHFSDETQEILGSSGALWKLKDWVGKDVLAVANGDTLSFMNWQRLLIFHQRHKAGVTLALRNHQNSGEEYTGFELTSDAMVKKLLPKSKSGLMFTGNYIINSELIDRLPEGVSGFVESILKPAIESGEASAMIDDSPWFDAGTLESYYQTQFGVSRIIDDVPGLRKLVELKMKELKRHVWVPKDWRENVFTFEAPVVMTGPMDHWIEAFKRVGKSDVTKLGPRLVGIDSPLPVPALPASDALLFSNHIQKFKN